MRREGRGFNDWTLRLLILETEKRQVNFIAIGWCHLWSRKDCICEPQAIYFPTQLLLLALSLSFNGCPAAGLIISTGCSLLTATLPSLIHNTHNNEYILTAGKLGLQIIL